MKQLLLLPLLAVLALNCDTTSSSNNRSTTTASLGAEFEIGYGNTVNIDSTSISVRFDDVLEDSRCATNVNCVWPGNAEISMDVSGQTIRLNTYEPPRQTTFGDYTIQLILLTPYPEESSAIDKEDYSATLIVSENSTFGN